MKQWICGANPMIKFTKKGQAYNLNSQTYLATQTAVFLASIYGEDCSNSGLESNLVSCSNYLHHAALGVRIIQLKLASVAFH